MINNVLFPQFEFLDLLVEVYFELVNGAFEQDHLLSLLLVVDSLVLWHGVVNRCLQFEVTEGGEGKFDVFLISCILNSGVHGDFLIEFFNFSLPLLALKLSLLTFTLMLGLFGVEFGLEGSFLLGS